jgi:hypothetical protein
MLSNLLPTSLIKKDRMKRLFLVFSCIVLSSEFYSQDLPQELHEKYLIPEYAYGDVSISLSPNLLCNTPNGVQLAGGFKINAYVCKWISFDADVVAGRDYLHFGPGLIGIPLFLLAKSQGFTDFSYPEVLLELFIIALSAEHVSGHIPVNEIVDISPYFSLMRFQFSYDDNYNPYSEYAGDQVSWAIGLQVNKYFNRLYISPYAEINVGYTDHIPRYNIGIYCGYFFYSK